jgi:hypothetical protein
MIIKIIPTILGLLIAAQNSMAKEWRGIVPLKSMRIDVERRFGKPDKWGNYQVGDERVGFDYSDGPCTDLYRALGKDNCYCLLKIGTVTSISVKPTAQRRVSDLKLDMEKFKRTPISPFPYTFEYSNRTEGITYEVDESDNTIRNIEYYAAAVDCENIIKSYASEYRNSWRGLIPLHANRRDVERLLGPPQRSWDSSATYSTDHELVTVKYAKGRCDVDKGEWDVADDTVLELVIGQRFPFLLDQLNLAPNRWEREEMVPFSEMANPPKIVNYVNHSDGVIIRAQAKAGGEEVVISILYEPAAKDHTLHCTGKRGAAKD